MVQAKVSCYIYYIILFFLFVNLCIYLDLHEKLFTRCTEFTNSNNINKKIIIFGLGSIGASIAEQLVRCSCSKFTLVDIDVVDYPNVARNTYTLRGIIM